MKNKRLIWYNPDLRKYQWGTGANYKELRSNSLNQEAFTLLFKFDDSNQTLAQKIIRELNSARKDETWETELRPY